MNVDKADNIELQEKIEEVNETLEKGLSGRTKMVRKLEQVKGVIEYPDAKRNDPCPCGSGKKYKRCHGPADTGQHPKYPNRHFRVVYEEVPVEEKEYVVPTPWVVKKNGVIVS